MAEFRKHQVYSKVPIEQCLERTWKNPIGVRWVDVNKGDELEENVRSRMVAQETKRRRNLGTGPESMAATFAATPPLEAVRVLLSLLMSGRAKKAKLTLPS